MKWQNSETWVPILFFLFFNFRISNIKIFLLSESANQFEDKIRLHTTIFWLPTKRDTNELKYFFLSFYDLKLVSMLSSDFQIPLLPIEMLYSVYQCRTSNDY